MGNDYQIEKKPAVFLDRDGTIIEYVKVPAEVAQIKVLPGAGSAIKRLNELGYLAIVITNQPVIEKGIITQAQADELNEVMKRQLKERAAMIDAVYMCPHRFRPEGSCACRKPNLGLLEQAQKDFPIDMARSWFVGDTARDMETGARAGIRTILVKTGAGDRDTQFFQTKGDYEATDFEGAVKIIEQAGR